MVEIGQGMGRKVVALLTDMEQPLGDAVGNALEVDEAVAVLKGKGPKDLVEVTMELTAEMLVLGQVADSLASARAQLSLAISSGRAMEKWEQLVAAQGGDVKAATQGVGMPRAKGRAQLLAPQDGFVLSMDCEAVGLASVALGAGRTRADQPVDPAVGFVFRKKVGDAVLKGEPLVEIHFNDEARKAEAEGRLLRAMRFSHSKPSLLPSVLERL
jgi:pyrimidine-nucleoside phosphorylase